MPKLMGWTICFFYGGMPLHREWSKEEIAANLKLETLYQKCSEHIQGFDCSEEEFTVIVKRLRYALLMNDKMTPEQKKDIYLRTKIIAGIHGGQAVESVMDK